MASSITLRAPKIALLSGSIREGSFNTKLLFAAKNAIERIAESSSGVDAKVLDLKDYSLPVYNEGLEDDGIPEAAQKLKAALGESDGFIIASPEFNGWPTPLLLNTYTWCSRFDPKDAPMYASFTGKSAIVLAASPGPLGGMRSLDPHRQYLSNLGVNVLPKSVGIGAAFRAFDDDHNNLVDPKQQGMLDAAVQALFIQARSDANFESLGQLVRGHIESTTAAAVNAPGAYGGINVPEE